MRRRFNMELQKTKRMRRRPGKSSENSARKGNWTVAESEETLRLLLDTANDYSVIRVTPEGKIASWNTGAERLYAYRADEIIGQQLFFPVFARCLHGSLRKK